MNTVAASINIILNVCNIKTSINVILNMGNIKTIYELIQHMRYRANNTCFSTLCYTHNKCDLQIYLCVFCLYYRLFFTSYVY